LEGFLRKNLVLLVSCLIVFHCKFCFDLKSFKKIEELKAQKDFKSVGF